MKNSIAKIPIASCEPVKSYAAGSIERKQIRDEYQKLMNRKRKQLSN